MTSYRLTPAAQRDLSSIWDYTAEQWGTRQAEIYLTEIREAIERVAADPRRGQPHDEIRPGYRRYSVGSHFLFYVEQTDGVAVIRILHHRMDSTRHF
ncbi:MAG: type II toxin-antitoxin system RelE/ParE family toxin [Aeromicrobium sp.]|uniref:type II toxin-antitoxin system RelE/ParE family toxin n=1 Tax=Aeromicrobium sp. TaxID=1871063 RepID=UPI0039E40DA5